MKTAKKHQSILSQHMKKIGIYVIYVTNNLLNK